MDVLNVKDLHKDYQLGEIMIHALSGVDIQINQGEFVTIMGPSGSGKSTLLHLLGGLDMPTKGDVSLAGEKYYGLDDREMTLLRRRNIGFIFQFFNLLPTLSAEENILLPVLIDGKREEDYLDWMNQLLRLVGLENRRNHKPDQLSGGEQQRVAIARALVTHPTILLADEPTGNLDSKTGKIIMDLIRKSCDELGQTVIVVTHDTRAAAYADRIIFLKDGKEEKQINFGESQTLVERIQGIMVVLEGMEI